LLVPPLLAPALPLPEPPLLVPALPALPLGPASPEVPPVPRSMFAKSSHPVATTQPAPINKHPTVILRIVARTIPGPVGASRTVKAERWGLPETVASNGRRH
jgi:hypothetical protein